MAYSTEYDVRAMEGMGDVLAYPDSMISDGLLVAEILIDEYTGTSWEAKAFSLTLSGTGGSRLTLTDPFDGRRILFPRSVTSCTVDGDAQTTGGWALFPEGYVLRDEGTFTYTAPGNNVVIAGTAGISTAVPEDVAFACRTIARQYCIDQVSNVDDRAVMLQTDMGTVRLSQPGQKYATGIPPVDAILMRRRQRGPVVA